MKRVYIDMDGVLCNFYKATKKALSENPNQKYPQSQWGFFLRLEEIPGAIDAFNELKKSYDVWILTRPSFKNVNCYTEKAQWVCDHLGYDALEKTIMSGDKSLLKGDYLIDDDLNANQERFEGELIKFSSDRFKNWSDVLEYLIPLDLDKVEKPKMPIKIEEFDYKKYLKIYEETNSDEHRSILNTRIISVQSDLLKLMSKYKLKPAEDDGYQEYRDEINEIRKKLKLI